MRTSAFLLLALILMSASAQAAPDPVPQNAVTRISGPNVFTDASGAQFTAFMYRVDVTPTVTAAPDCSADLRLMLCVKPGTRVVDWHDWYKVIGVTDGTITLRHLPQGTTQFSVVHPGVYQSAQIAYALNVDGKEISGDTYGAQCGPTAVALSGLSAGVDGIQMRDLVLLALLAIVALLVRWALRGRKANSG